MCQINVLQAKTELSKLIVMLEKGEEEEIVIARNGVPAARLTLWKKTGETKRIGVAKGLFQVPDNFDEDDAFIASSFSSKEL